MKLQKFQLGGVQTKKLESNDATPFMNFFKFLVPGFKLAYDQKLAQLNYDAKMKAQYRVRIPLQEVPTSVYKPKVLLVKKPKKDAPVALGKPITKHQGGGQFQENLAPPSRGLFGEIGTNLLQGNEIMGKIVGSLPMLILGFGIGAGLGGSHGPAMRVGRTIKEAFSNPRNTMRRFSRNITARKGDASYRGTETSGGVLQGTPSRYAQGQPASVLSRILKTAKSEGSGYNALSILNNNPTYLLASLPVQTGILRQFNHMHSAPIEQLISRLVMQRNNLIDLARNWRNYIFEGPYGKLNYK